MTDAGNAAAAAAAEARRQRNYEIQWEIIKKAREIGVDPMYLAAEVIIGIEGKMPRLRQVEPTAALAADWPQKPA